MANAAAGLVDVGLADTGLAEVGLANTGLADDEPAGSAGSALREAPLIDDLLVEEISIDGMCGVY
jgi:mycofactocin precursor